MAVLNTDTALHKHRNQVNVWKEENTPHGKLLTSTENKTLTNDQELLLRGLVYILFNMTREKKEQFSQV